MKNRHRLWSLRIHSNYPLSAFVSIIRLGNTRMIVDERLVTYINSLDRGNTPVLDEIEKEALRDFVPIIRKEMQSFLKLLESKKPLYDMLSRATDMEFTIRIGSENDIDQLKDMSIVTATYKIGEKNMGSFGVIGPTRMDYSKVVSILSYVGASMNELLSGFLDAADT